MARIVLFVDNTASFLDTYSKLLEQEGFQVIKAHTIDEARKCLESVRVHLAILDIRMTDENDLNDSSGLDWAKDERYRALPKVILTAYPYEHYDHLLSALGLGLDSHEASLIHLLKYLSKKEAPTELIPVVNWIFDSQLRIDWNLSIRSAGPSGLSSSHLAGLVEPHLPPELIPDRAGEVEDLFRTLFYGFEQLALGRVLLQRENGAFLEAFAYPKVGPGRQFIVHCGRPQAIRSDDERYHHFAPQTDPSILHREDAAETLHCAATAYSLSGGDLEELISLTTFYERHSGQSIMVALDQFFQGPLISWHGQGQFQEETRPLPVYWQEWLKDRGVVVSSEKMQECLKGITLESLAAGLGQVDYTPNSLTLHLPGGSSRELPNPLVFYQGKRAPAGQSVRCGPVHGRPDPSAILLGPSGQSWLLDFSWIGNGPQVRDFAVLENAIKLDLAELGGLSEWLELERVLHPTGRLGDPLSEQGLAPALLKAVQAIGRVRSYAARTVGDEPGPYLQGLLCEALERIGRYDPAARHTRREVRPFLHALLSAAIIAEALAGPVEPPRSLPEHLPEQARNSLWHDWENREAWVKGRCVQLTDQESKVLGYLLQRAGRLCRWRAIVEEALGEKYEGSEQEKTRLTSLMSRLREKIEREPSRPEYLLTVRGEGYKVVLEC